MQIPRLTTRQLIALVAGAGLLSSIVVELSLLRIESQQLIFASVERRFIPRLQAVLIAAVVVTAVAALATAQRRRAKYLSLASSHAQSEQSLWEGLAKARRGYDRQAEVIAYHNRMKQKYLRAASRPWLSVPPDLPPE